MYVATDQAEQGLNAKINDDYRGRIDYVDDIGNGLRRIFLRCVGDANPKKSEPEPTLYATIIAPESLGLEDYRNYRFELRRRIECGEKMVDVKL